MPARGEGGDSPLVWLLAAAPALVFAVLLAVPGWRAQLLGEPAARSTPAAAQARLRPVTPAVQRSAAASVPPRPAAPDAASHRAATIPVASPSPPRSASAASPTPLSLASGRELDRFLEQAWRPHLGRGVGPLTARLEGSRAHISAVLDLVALRERLQGRLPEALEGLVRGSAEVEVTARIVSAGDGVARIAVEGLRVGAVRLPRPLLELFFEGELRARGLASRDPLVRKIYLPPGFASGTIEGDRLRLEPAAER